MIRKDFITFVIDKFEKGFTFNKNDPGGATNWGITHRTLAKARGVDSVTVDEVKELEKDEAIKIYEDRYWHYGNCEKMKEPISFLHFDCVVNCGVRGAGRVLQNALKQYGFRDITIDGLIGPQTLGYMENVDDLKTFAFLYQTERIRRYYFITGKNRKLNMFLRGWVNRVAILSEYISKLYFIPTFDSKNEKTDE